MSTHRIFLDESGQREFGNKTSNYFVVGGVACEQHLCQRLEDELSGLKRAFFGTCEVEVKSNWLRIPKETATHYIDKYNITRETLDQFCFAFYRWVQNAPITLIAGVVDKVQLTDQYSKPHYPSGVAYTLLLQRYQKLLAKHGSTGDVILDDTSGKTSAGNEWKVLLTRQHTKLKKHGCPYTKVQFGRIADCIQFVNSKDSSLIQIADIVSYNTMRQFRDYGSIWDDPVATDLPLYPYFRLLLPKFDRSNVGIYSGYGVAKMPLKGRNCWALQT